MKRMKPIGKFWQNILLSTGKSARARKNFQVSKERLQKNAVNATRQPTLKSIAVNRQPYQTAMPAGACLYLARAGRQAPAGMGVGPIAHKRCRPTFKSLLGRAGYNPLGIE